MQLLKSVQISKKQRLLPKYREDATPHGPCAVFLAVFLVVSIGVECMAKV